MRFFALHFKKSAAAKWLVPVCLLAWLYSTDRTSKWNHYALAMSAHSNQAFIFLGPVVAGTAAWDASRFRRSGLQDLVKSSVRGRAQLAVVGILSSFLVGLVGFLVVFIGSSLHMADLAGSPDLTLPAMTLLALLAMSAIGFAIGMSAPRFVAPVIAVLVAYLWAVSSVAARSGPLRYSAAFYYECCAVSQRVQPNYLRAQVLFASGLLVAGFVGAIWGRRAAASPVPVGATAIAVLLLAVGTVHLAPIRDDGLENRPPVALGPPDCISSSSHTVCTFPEDRGEQASVLKAAQSIATATSGLDYLPRYFIETGMVTPASFHQPAVRFGTPLPDEAFGDYLARFADHTLPDYPACARHSNGDITYPALPLRAYLRGWLLWQSGYPAQAERTVPPNYLAVLRAVVTAPVDRQRAWFAAGVEATKSCTSTPRYVP